MTRNYCPLCLEETESVSVYLDSGPQVLCEVCGVVMEEALIHNPDSPGESSQSQSRNLPEFVKRGTLGSRPSDWAQLEALKREESERGRQYRRHIGKKQSQLYRTICDSIDSTASKLYLDDRLKRRIAERFEQLRGRKGFAGIRNRRDTAPALGVACVLWVCRSEGMPISTTRMATLSEIKKDILLRALVSLEKLIGSPVPPHAQCTKAAEVDLDRVGTVLEKCLSNYHFEESQMLLKCLLRLGIIPEKCASEAAVCCAFFLAKGHLFGPKQMVLKGFCKKIGLDFSRQLEALENGLRVGLGQLVTDLNLSPCFPTASYWVTHLRDFVQVLNTMDGKDVPKGIFHKLIPEIVNELC